MRHVTKWVAAITAMLSLGSFALAADAPRHNGAGRDPTDYPHKILSNGAATLTVVLPDARRGYYRGPRFDWSGMIVRAESGGHSFFGDWKTTHNPENNDDTTGPAEEYGMAAPLGYAEAKVGETFLKIGVGRLEKIAEPKYNFFHAYKIVEPGAWKVRSGDDWIEFHQTLTGEHGYGYAYTKRVALTRGRASFTISHVLRNTGSRPLNTSEYCHNFVLIDRRPIGRAYRVGLAFEPRLKHGKAPDGPVEVRGRQLVFRDDVAEGKSFYAEFTGAGDVAANNRILIENEKAGAGIRITGSLPLAELHVWGTKDTISTEPFIQLDLAPGKEARWETGYTLLTGAAGNRH